MLNPGVELAADTAAAKNLELASVLVFTLLKEPIIITLSLVNAAAPAGVLSGPGVFATTRWSLILSAADSTGNEQKARDVGAGWPWKPNHCVLRKPSTCLELVARCKP
jgi:hypothetical protein